MKKYVVFNTLIDVFNANGRWLFYRYTKGYFDKKKKDISIPQITSAFDDIKQLKDGRYATGLPDYGAREFVGNDGVIEVLTEKDFIAEEGAIDELSSKRRTRDT